MDGGQQKRKQRAQQQQQKQKQKQHQDRVQRGIWMLQDDQHLVVTVLVLAGHSGHSGHSDHSGSLGGRGDGGCWEKYQRKCRRSCQD